MQDEEERCFIKIQVIKMFKDNLPNERNAKQTNPEHLPIRAPKVIRPQL